MDGKSVEVLDGEILEVVRFGMKSRWVEHFSMEMPTPIVVRDDKFKGLPATGFTFMVSSIFVLFCLMLIRRNCRCGSGFQTFPAVKVRIVYCVHMPLRVLLKLSLRTDGELELISSSNSQPAA